MSQEQTIIIPEKCMACKSDRVGISDGRAVYRCGSTINFNGKKVRVTRTVTCIEDCVKKGGEL